MQNKVAIYFENIHSDNNYHRKLERGESNCFVALDQKQLILEVGYIL